MLRRAKKLNILRPACFSPD